MLVIRIEDEEIARKLRERAEQENRSVDEIVGEMLSTSMDEQVNDPEFFGSGAHLAQIAQRANIRTENPISAVDADKVLEEIYEEKWSKRLKEREGGKTARSD